LCIFVILPLHQLLHLLRITSADFVINLNQLSIDILRLVGTVYADVLVNTVCNDVFGNIFDRQLLIIITAKL